MKHKNLIFKVLDSFTTEEARIELEKNGLTDIFVIEDDAVGEVCIGGRAKKEVASTKSVLIEEKSGAVDWEEQWSLFAENFVDGKARIPVGDQTLLLTPGPGFGDLSHPTTYLMLEMMQDFVSGESIIDIGTGSGILALAALLLGAQSAIGIDIDAAALDHAKQNAKLNHLTPKFSPSLPKNLPAKNIFLMNMILPEQKEFEPQRMNPLAKLWIVSGILASQRDVYLIQAKTWRWSIVAEHQKGEWLGWVMRPNQ